MLYFLVGYEIMIFSAFNDCVKLWMHSHSLLSYGPKVSLKWTIKVRPLPKKRFLHLSHPPPFRFSSSLAHREISLQNELQNSTQKYKKRVNKSILIKYVRVLLNINSVNCIEFKFNLLKMKNAKTLSTIFPAF